MTSVACEALAIGGSWLLWLVGLFVTSCGPRRRAAAAPDGGANDVPARGRRATAE
jgi:hypothetical protein